MNAIAFTEADLERLERLVYARRMDDAAREVIVLLDRIGQVFYERATFVHAAEETRLYTRLAGAIAVLLADREFQLSELGFAGFVLNHAAIDFIFSASAYASSDFVLRLVEPPHAARQPIDARLRRKLLLAWSLDSEIELDLGALLDGDPALMLPAWLGLQHRRVFLTVAACRRREELLRLAARFEGSARSEIILPALAVAWMNCMYASSPAKHVVRRSLNALLRAVVPGGAAAPAVRGAAAAPKRPVMLVPLEAFRAAHVNYRTYGALVRGLREHFTLVAACKATDIDEESRALFDRVVAIEEPANLQALGRILDLLAAVGADIVYYPTVGLSLWSIAAATRRLAPIQAVTLGVPATTHSDAIDYVLVEESWAGSPDCYSETVVLARRGSTRFVGKPDYGVPRRARPRPAGAALRVGVPSTVMKLNAGFLACCARIHAAARLPLEWHFFAGMAGLHHRVARTQIRRWIPDARVHPYMEYVEHMRLFDRCEVHLSTFPFGGTNTNLDAMYLGIPTVTLEGREAHSQIDAGMLRRAGLPAWLICRDEDEYERTALRLLHEAHERARISQQLLDTDLEQVFMETGAASRDDFVEAFCWLHARHEAIQSSGRRWWTVGDRARDLQSAGEPSRRPA